MNDLISRQAAIDTVLKESNMDGSYGYMDAKSIVDLLNKLPSAQSDWNEMIVICDCCGHAIHVKRQ